MSFVSKIIQTRWGTSREKYLSIDIHTLREHDVV